MSGSSFVFDPFGINAIGAKVDNASKQLTQIQVTLATILTKIGAIMATEADVQAAADAITAAVQTIQTQLTGEDAAITAILAWVQAHPATPLPDALVQQLGAAKTAMDAVAADLTTQTQNLTAGTPAP